LMLVYDLPEPRSIRIIWNAFIHEGGCAVGQRAVNGVAVASDPANIRRAPVDIAFVIIEYVFERHACLQQVAAGAVQYALGFAGRAGGIEDEKRVFCIYLLGLAMLARYLQRLVIPKVALWLPFDFSFGPAYDQYRGNLRAGCQRQIDVGLERNTLAAAHALIGCNYRGAVGIVDTIAQRIG